MLINTVRMPAKDTELGVKLVFSSIENFKFIYKLIRPVTEDSSVYGHAFKVQTMSRTYMDTFPPSRWRVWAFK